MQPRYTNWMSWDNTEISRILVQTILKLVVGNSIHAQQVLACTTGAWALGKREARVLAQSARTRASFFRRARSRASGSLNAQAPVAQANQATAINIDFLKMRGPNNLKSLQNFSSCNESVIHFHPGHRQPKTLMNSFSVLIQQLLNGPLFLGFSRHKLWYIFWLLKEMLKIRDRAPWKIPNNGHTTTRVSEKEEVDLHNLSLAKGIIRRFTPASSEAWRKISLVSEVSLHSGTPNGGRKKPSLDFWKGKSARNFGKQGYTLYLQQVCCLADDQLWKYLRMT